MAVKFCPNCGNRIDDSSNFCPKCGYNLAEFKNKQSNEKHETQERDHISYHKDDPTNNPIVEEEKGITSDNDEEEQTDNESVNSSIIEEENQQIKSDPDYKAYKALGDSSMSFAEYKRHKKELQTMEPIPKHEKKEGILTTDLYQSLVAHPEQINELCKAITAFDRDILYKRYQGELMDSQNDRKRQNDLSNLYLKSTELEARLHNLNRHMAGNTTILKNMEGFFPPNLYPDLNPDA